MEARPLNETLPPHRPLGDSARQRTARGERDELETKEVPNGRTDRLGSYVIEAKVSEGGMGQVYRCFDPTLERRVAIKVLHDKFGQDPRYRERFLREARTIASLNHPRIAQIYGIETTDDRLSIVMEFVDGQSLDQALAERGRVPAAEVEQWVRQAAVGLHVAALQGIVHRDVKPSNLLLDRHGNVKIVDFGLAKDLGSSRGITDEGIVLGTPQYLSPEQGRGKTVDIRSDIYSLGATFFHLLTGKTPFDKNSQIATIVAHVEESPPSPQDLRDDVPSEVVDVIGRMMAVAPEDRYPGYGELIEDLDRLIAGRTPIHASPERGRFAHLAEARVRRERRRRGIVLAVSVLLAVSIAGAAVAAWLCRPTRPSPPDFTSLGSWHVPSDGEATTFRFDFRQLPENAISVWNELWVRPADPSVQAPEIREREGRLVWDDAEAPMTCSWIFDRLDGVQVYVDEQSGPFDFGISIDDPHGPSLRSLSVALRPSFELEDPVHATRHNDAVELGNSVPPPMPGLKPPYALFLAFREAAADSTELAIEVREYSPSGESSGKTLYDATVVLPGRDWNSGALTFLCSKSVERPFRLAVSEIVASGRIDGHRLEEDAWRR